jgi:uncharacterized protein
MPRVNEELVRFLSERSLERIETHMAFVFLTVRHAYKLKKPVRYAFLDFSTVERRTCEDEVRLNRRLAPDVYIGTVPIVRDRNGELRFGPIPGTPTVDWLVKMRRLPRDRMLDHILRAGDQPARDDVEAVSRLLTDFYGRLPAEPMSPDTYVDRLREEIAGDVVGLTERADHLPGDLIRAIGAALTDTLRMHETRFRARVLDGRIIEGHGDLRPEHICLTRPPTIIDCLEFCRDFRLLDPIDELAFLAMECERLGSPGIGARLLDDYQRRLGDYVDPALIEFHMARRALLRAKLAIWHLRDGDGDAAGVERWTQQARQYLALAARHASVEAARSPASRHSVADQLGDRAAGVQPADRLTD